jgi:AcrR family transcriptional regulator
LVTHCGKIGRVTSTSGSGPGRPPDPDIERRAIEATLEIYSEVGWAGFTFDAVARRAKVGKAALYRRWPSKQDLIVEAIETLRLPRRKPVTGPIRDDLRSVAESLTRRYAGRHGLAFLRAQLEAKVYPDVLGAAMDTSRKSIIAKGRKIILSAVERGELPPGTSPGMVMDGLAGAIVNHILMAPETRVAEIADDPAQFSDRVVDLVLDGARAAARTPVS